MSVRSQNLDYQFICACCNSPITLLNHPRHLRSPKHKKNMFLYLRDNPDFKESIYQQKIRNLSTFLAMFNHKEFDLSPEIKYILNTPVDDYLIGDYCSGFVKNITYENKFEISHFANGMY